MPIRPENKPWYPRDWKLRSYFVRFVRGKSKCEWCGAAHKKPHWLTGARVILTTAHIHERVNGNPHKLLNLAGLCQLCHNRHDATNRAKGRMYRKRINSPQGDLFL